MSRATVTRGVVLLSALALLVVPNYSQAAELDSTAKVTGRAGATAVIGGWQIRDSSQVSDGGPAISAPDYNASGWFGVGPRSTVMSGLLQNGKYPNIFYSTTMKSVDSAQFKRDWWYRSTFTASGAGMHTVLHLAGVSPRADVWLNGKQIATKAQVAGGHNGVDIDVTAGIRQGPNGLALRITPADPKKDFITGWIDWNPTPPDNN